MIIIIILSLPWPLSGLANHYYSLWLGAGNEPLHQQKKKIIHKPL